IRFLADLYHLASNGEALAAVLPRHARETGHVQIADVPGRHQPGTGGLDFEKLFALLASTGYRGHVGLEYRPLGPPELSFDWLPVARRASSDALGGGGSR
ncbi:MAG TPA: TIM barrel protein, partial [Candidatus Dormibacteraeota bacterium]|nr:TIM barrel protein [Candidatus Dormibacteraeota bacterium]